MDLRKIKTLIELVEQSGVAELEVKEGEESVRISRFQGGIVPPMLMAGNYAPMAAPAPAPAPAPTAMAAPVAAPVAPPAAPTSATRHIVKSPMVGSFYRAASPGAKPFIEVGQEDVFEITVCGGVDRNGADAEFATGAQNAQRDLAAIGD